MNTVNIGPICGIQLEIESCLVDPTCWAEVQMGRSHGGGLSGRIRQQNTRKIVWSTVMAPGLEDSLVDLLTYRYLYSLNIMVVAQQ